MLSLAANVRAALEENHSPSYRVSAFYGSDQTLAEVPVTFDGSISFQADSAIQGAGSVFLAKDGPSLVPREMTDPLAPYGQELQIDRVLTVGQDTYTIPLGRFRITDVPSMKEYFRLYPSVAESVGWEAKLELKDRFDIIEADDFLSATAPVRGNTTWDEIRRISPIPIVASLPDQTLPSGLVYESRAEAISTLMKNLGGVPHMTRQGALTARRANAWLTETVPAFTIGGVIELDDAMSNDVYNSVVVTTSKNPAILSVKDISDPASPLSVTSPLRRRTYKLQDPLVTTQAQADATALTMLARLSTRRSRVATVTCLPRPDLELGDFGRVIDPISGRQVLGEISELSFSLDPFAPMTVKLIVSESA
jgi:hypothetical protein